MVIGIDASRAEAKLKTGVERYSFELIRAMRASLPPETEVVLYSRVPLPRELGPFDDRWRNRVLAWPFKFFWTQIRLSWEMLRRPPGVLFVPGHLLPRIVPKRTVVTVHDASFLGYPQFYPPSARAILAAGLKDACRRAGLIIVPSKFVAEQLAPLRLTDISVIPHGVRISKPVTHYSLLPTPRFIVLGRVEKKKNPEVVIDAFAKFARRHPDHRLIFVGGMSYGSDEIVAKVQGSEVSDRIEFTGPLPDNEMYRLVKNAAALLHPCPIEGFGMPVIEAMALGTPVIAASVGAAAEAAGDAALLVSPLEADKWSEAMEQVTFDIFRKTLIEKGLSRAKEFTWPRAAVATWTILTKTSKNGYI